MIEKICLLLALATTPVLGLGIAGCPADANSNALSSAEWNQISGKWYSQGGSIQENDKCRTMKFTKLRSDGSLGVFFDQFDMERVRYEATLNGPAILIAKDGYTMNLEVIGVNDKAIVFSYCFMDMPDSFQHKYMYLAMTKDPFDMASAKKLTKKIDALKHEDLVVGATNAKCKVPKET